MLLWEFETEKSESTTEIMAIESSYLHINKLKYF
jgi:hypothetical protein